RFRCAGGGFGHGRPRCHGARCRHGSAVAASGRANRGAGPCAHAPAGEQCARRRVGADRRSLYCAPSRRAEPGVCAVDGRHLLALVLTCGAGVVAVGALTARSLFALCMYVAAAAALATGAALALGAGDAGLGLALFAAAWAPVLLLAAMLLSGRTVKPTRRS